MQTRNRKVQMSYKVFIAELHRHVLCVKETYDIAQLTHIKELYTMIAKHIVEVYMAYVHDSPGKYSRFAELISVMYNKSEEFLHQININTGKKLGVFDAIYKARTAMFEIAEPVIPEVCPATE
jgi:hypothetical protein